MKAFQDLVKSPGWALLVEAAEGQAGVRQPQPVPFKGLEDAFEWNFTLGEIAGIKMFMLIPATAIEAGETVIKALLQQEKEERDAERE